MFFMLTINISKVIALCVMVAIPLFQYNFINFFLCPCSVIQNRLIFYLRKIFFERPPVKNTKRWTKKSKKMFNLILYVWCPAIRSFMNNETKYFKIIDNIFMFVLYIN
jgi:hypothetical protein